METWSEITCPHCFETFAVPAPPIPECPAEWDYDCEVCCRPMIIYFDHHQAADARSLAD